jgi:hypothetical protein
MTRDHIMQTLAVCIGLSSTIIQADELKLKFQKQVETSPASGRFHTIKNSGDWKPSETAIIVCDVWDAHHAWNNFYPI